MREANKKTAKTTRKAAQAATTTAAGAPKRKFNWWQLATIILAGLILGTGVWFSSKFLAPVSEPKVESVADNASEPAFTVNLTKRQVNRIVDYYLGDYLKDSDVKYSLTLGNQAVLAGHFKFFGAKIKFELLFDPLVQKNGNVELKARKLNIGSLSVPISFVLNYVGHSYKLPKWVSLDSKAETVVLRLNKFKMANKMKIRARKIDLLNDQITFAVYLPSK